MHRDVIVGYDGSDSSRDALALAGVLAASPEVRVLVAYVYPSVHDGAQRGDGRVREEAMRTAQRGRELLTYPDEAEACAVAGGSAVPGLAEFAVEADAAVVVIGSSPRGPVGRIAPGSVACGLLAGAPCAVAIAPAGYAESEHRSPQLLGVALDDSPESERALHVAERLTAHLGARLRIVAVANPDTDDVEQVSWRLDEAAASAPVIAYAESQLRQGDPAEQLALASRELDLLVCGSRGYGSFGRVVLGSVSRELVSSAACPMMILPRGAELGLPATASQAPAEHA